MYLVINNIHYYYKYEIFSDETNVGHISSFE